MTIPVSAVAGLDSEAFSAAAAAVRGLFADAIRGALVDVACGPEPAEDDETGTPELSQDEASLLDAYRRSTDVHRQAARRTLERGAPPEEG